MKKNIILIATILFVLVGLSACSSKKLKGTYTTKINVILAETTNTLTFKDDTVTERQDGEVTNKGTYTISDNKLEIKLGDYHMTADLSKDRKSFTITSSDVLGGVGKGLNYTLEEK